jgi:hypothetical protein
MMTRSFCRKLCFFKHLNDWSLEIFGPTIHIGWDKQIKNLKDELINRLIGLFGVETFNRVEVLNKFDQHMKIVRDQYKVHLETNPRYEFPPMIPVREWKALLDDGRERALRKHAKLPPGTGRYAIL